MRRNDFLFLAAAVLSTTIVFCLVSNWRLDAQSATPPTVPAAQPAVHSTIRIYNLKTGDTREVFQSDGFYEAPYWSADGKYLQFDGGPAHKLYRIPAAGGAAEVIDIGNVEVNHDQGQSPDAKWNAISLKGELFVSAPDGKGRHRVTKPGDIFYVHTWSLDSRWILGTRRFPEANYDVCRITPDGKQDERLTSNPALDDGPDYTKDGKWIYFNSNRSGNFDIWRMPPSGAGPNDRLAERVTSDPSEDWFPHPSPDGKWLLFLSYHPGTGAKMSLKEYLARYPEKGLSGYNLTMHPYNADVSIRIIPLPGASVEHSDIRMLSRLIGGQGSLNLHSWMPDSSGFAFVSYEVLSK